MRYRIAEVAELTGVPATTIRFYEAEGLLHPAERQENGYRSFDDRDVVRLRFVARARNLDLPVEDLRELVRLWDDDDCSEVAVRMRDRVTDHLADVQRRLVELMGLAGELQRVAAKLSGTSPSGPCSDACVCVDPATASEGVTLVPSDGDATPIDCSLPPAALPARIADWQSLLEHAIESRPVPGGMAIHFPADPPLASRLTALIGAEQDCCTFLSFSLTLTDGYFLLVVTAPAEAAPVLDAILGPCTPTSDAADPVIGARRSG